MNPLPSLRPHNPLLACWNWKCALMSAIMRSFVYLAAMIHSRMHDRVAVVLVEVAYVTMTAGVYAGMQQRALGLRSRLLGDSIVVLWVPLTAQALDWLAHRVAGAAVTGKATLAVSVFATLSALFHLHVMRNGVFLTGGGRSLADDFRRIPRLLGSFALKPITLFSEWTPRPARALESDPAA